MRTSCLSQGTVVIQRSVVTSVGRKSKNWVYVYIQLIGFAVQKRPRWLSGKESACKAGDTGPIPGSERSPGQGNGSPVQDSYLGKSHGQRSLSGVNPWRLRKSRLQLSGKAITK